MTGINKDYVSQYILELIPEYTGIIYDIDKEGRENNIPIISREVANFLKLIIRSKGIKNILEIGTATGFSGVFMLSNTEEGRLTTVDINEERISEARKNFEKAGLIDRVEFLQGDGKEVIRSLEPGYDLIFIDGAKSDYKEIFERSLELLDQDGIIICDNVLFRGMVADEEPNKRYKTIVRNMREFLDYAFKLPHAHSSLLPLGDGLLLTIRS